MPPAPKPTSPLRLRLATLLFPPLGLWLLWRGPQKIWRKILGTVGVLLFSLLYTALIVFLLIRYTGLEVEWRGGYVPRLTYHKTKPNYDALDRDRARRAMAASQTNSLPSPALSSKDEDAPWPGFRGPRRDGQYDAKPILTNWPASGLRLLWRQPVGGGYASFAVAEGLAFTIEQRREQEVATAYEVETGREAWTHAWPARFTEPLGGDGPRATPAYSDGRVYALGAEGELRCLEALTGKLVWSKNILTESQAETPPYGVAASPLLVEDKVIALTSAGRGKSALCYDKLNGKPLWTSLDDSIGHTSPMLATLAGLPQIIISSEIRTVGLRVADGKPLWEYPWRVLHEQRPIAQPVLLGTNRFMLSAGYFTGCAAIEVVRTESGFAARAVWQNKNLKNKFSSSVFWQGHIYGLDEDILTCLDAEAGQRKWKDGHYGYGQLLLASGHLVILSGEGELALVKAAPDRYQEVARFSAIHGKTWNHPAIANGKLFVRNSAEMACFEIGPGK
jgi:outer membrane protein assembly factor BamB